MKRKPYTVIFVCTGNLCRSPMAEVILIDKLKKQGIQNGVVKSAGVAAPKGMSAASMAQTAVARYGLDLTGHRAQFLTADLVKEADVILVMEQAHKKEIQEWFHQAAGKVHLLKAYLGDGYQADVEDPIGRGLDAFDFCYQDLEKEIGRILPGLIEEIGKHE